MSTPTKPERVEVGGEWKVGQRRRGPLLGVHDGGCEYIVRVPVTHGPGAAEVDCQCAKHAGKETGFSCISQAATEQSTLIAPAPATPGTATVTPAPGQRWRDEWDGREIIIGERLPTSNGRWRWALLDNPGCGYLEHYFTDGRLTYLGPGAASKPPAAPAYGRMVGELRAPDGTPLSALEAIQAKREPERWLPSCDIDCDIPDADEGWRR